MKESDIYAIDTNVCVARQPAAETVCSCVTLDQWCVM